MYYINTVYTCLSISLGLHRQIGFKGTPQRFGRVTHINIFFEKPIFSCNQNLYFGTLIICPVSIWKFGLNMECIC